MAGRPQLTEPEVVRKAAEGCDRPNAEVELPIDINYQKLTEWLVARQKLPADWHKRLQAIHSKIAEAVKELPAGLLSQLPWGSDAAVDYFRAVEIRDKLAESGDRTLFGGLSGQAGIWDKIVKAYDKGGVFIGEAAQTMVQNVDYEIPYLRRQVAKCNQQMADADRRHAEYTRSAATGANKYKKECEQLGITGAAIGQELWQLTNELPQLFHQLVDDLRSTQLATAITYYQRFTQYTHSSSDPACRLNNSSSGTAGMLPSVLPVLTEVREGTTAPVASGAANSTAAAVGAAADASATAPSIDQCGLHLFSTSKPEAPSSSIAAGEGIDWGLDLAAAADTAMAAADTGDDAAPSGISWELEDSSNGVADGAAGAGKSSSAAVGISWDIALEQPAVGNDAAPAAGAPNFEWDIDMSGTGADGSNEGTNNAAAAAAASGISWDVELGPTAHTNSAAAASSRASGQNAAAAAAARASDALASADVSAHRLQHDSEYRNQFIDDLQELQAFLVSRKVELSGSGSSSSADLLRALAPEVVANTDAGDVRSMLAQVEKLLAAVNDDRLRQLLMISTSSRYVERLQGSLQRKAGQEAKMLAAAAETQARKQESRAALAGIQPKLAEVVDCTRKIKKAVEAALSKQFNGRHINVLGEINNALTLTS